MSDDAILRVRDLRKYYGTDSGAVARALDRLLGDDGGTPAKAVDGISFDVGEAETFGLVGESGCGKSTVAQTLLNLLPATGGSAEYRTDDGWVDIVDPDVDESVVREDIQMVFQDPESSLNPRRTVGEAIRRPLAIHDIGTEDEQRSRVVDLLERVGLSASHYDRYPHEFSGGQQQRIAIARALAVDPSFIVLDEPTSALDVSIQGQILNLLEDLQDEFGVSYLFISHDLSVIQYVADRIGVMYLGEMVETGPTEAVFERPSHPYTISLLSSIPKPDPHADARKINLTGDVPSPEDPPSGCKFHTRCPVAIEDECRAMNPELERVPSDEDGSHLGACHLMDRDFDMETFEI
ncbi:ABC transporter ATP-binding protein [Halorussus halobius]|uniref:ABC transporter ATP-binding protein n=1 Tax=Halorussus halobius TaxID=1710537 RepID=UPI001092084C|nr:oligopeptide/dipeptide ABC transporter ATP-binding protein [Halorussus halobius]